MFPKRFNSSFCSWSLNSNQAEDLDRKPCVMVSFSAWQSNSLMGLTVGKFLCSVAEIFLIKHVGTHYESNKG